jgi:ribose 1,5-bisphosphokinase PhnN
MMISQEPAKKLLEMQFAVCWHATQQSYGVAASTATSELAELPAGLMIIAAILWPPLADETRLLAAHAA